MARITGLIIPAGAALPKGVPAIIPARERDLEEIAVFLENKGPFAMLLLQHTKADKLRDWYWAVVQPAADAKGILKDDLHVQLKVKTQFVRNWAIGDLGPVPILRSISRGITLYDLRRYVDAAMECLITQYMVDPQDFVGSRRRAENQIDEWAGPRPD